MFCLYCVRRCSYPFILQLWQESSVLTPPTPQLSLFPLIFYFFSSCSIFPLFLNSPRFPLSSMLISFLILLMSPSILLCHNGILLCFCVVCFRASSLATYCCINEILFVSVIFLVGIFSYLIDPASNFFCLALVCLFEVDRIIAS